MRIPRKDCPYCSRSFDRSWAPKRRENHVAKCYQQKMAAEKRA